MNKKLILGFLSACLVAGFWACGTGDIETVGSGDENALGLYGFDPDAMDGLVSKAKQDCKDDPDCVAAQEGATAIGDEDDDDDPSDEDEESSDSEGESSDSEESSSATIESSSATGTSSATPNSSAIVASSSGTAASSAAVGSSSSTGLSSSSAKSSSSIQSSSSAGPGPAKGTCKATTVTITKGSSVTWKAYRMGGTFVTYDWTFSDGSGIASSKDSVPSVKYDKPGTYTATLVINKGTDTTSTEIKCGNVIVTGTKIEGCTCTNPDSSKTLFYKSGSPASSTWKVSGCKNADGSAADFTYSWSGAVSGTSASATASLSSASTFSAQVTVKNGDGSTATPTCPSVVTAAQMTATCAFKGNNTSSNASLPGKSMYFSASSFQNWPATLSSPASMVLKGNGEDKTYSVNKGSSINQMITAPSKPGIYTYSFEVNESQVCTADLVVNQLKASCPTIEGEIGKQVTVSITPDGITNQQFTRYIKLKDSTVTYKTCQSGNCQSMSFNMLKTKGSYTYDLYADTEKLCSGTLKANNPKATASCSFVEYPLPGKSVKMNVNNYQNWSYMANQQSMILEGNGGSKEITFDKSTNAVYVDAPSAVGSYDYYLKFEGNQFCKATMTVKTLTSSGCTFDGEALPGQSMTLKIPSLSNWPSSLGSPQTMDLNAPAAGYSEEVSIPKGSTKNVSIAAPETPGTYTYTLSYEGNTVCSASLKVNQLSATCHDLEIYPGQTLSSASSATFNMQGLTTLAVPIKIEVDGDSIGGHTSCKSSSCSSIKYTIPKTFAVGTYSYDLYMRSSKVCSGKFVAKDPLTCSVDKQEIGLGESFTFTTTYANGCSSANTTQDGSSFSSNCKTSQSIMPTSTGTHTYVYSVTNGSYGVSSCKASVVVKDVPPSCAVPSMNAAINKTLTFTPSSSIGCYGEDCSYTVTGGTMGGISGDGFRTGESITGLTGEAKAGTTNYTLSLTNSIGSGTCSFGVTYVNADVVVSSKGAAFTATNGTKVWVSGDLTGGLRCYHGYQSSNCTVDIESASTVTKTIGNCNSNSGWNYVELPLSSLNSDRIATITFTDVSDGSMTCSVQ